MHSFCLGLASIETLNQVPQPAHPVARQLPASNLRQIPFLGLLPSWSLSRWAGDVDRMKWRSPRRHRERLSRRCRYLLAVFRPKKSSKMGKKKKEGPRPPPCGQKTNKKQNTAPPGGAKQ